MFSVIQHPTWYTLQHFMTRSNNLQDHNLIPQNRCYISVRTKRRLHGRQAFFTLKQTAKGM